MNVYADPPVVVGIDGTGASADAVAWAAREALLRRRPLRLVHAYTLPPADESGRGPASVAARRAYASAQRSADAQRAQAVRLVPDVPVEVTVREGGRAEMLLAEAVGAELVVVGGGEANRTGQVSGAVGAQLSAYAPVPVLVVRGGPDPSGPSVGRVVAGVAATETCGDVLEAAFLEADLRHLPLTVVHGQGTEGHHGKAFGGARILSEALAGWREKFLHIQVETRLADLAPAAAVVQLSRGAELVVVGDRGAGGFDGLRLGSVAQAAVHHSACPVLVVPTSLRR
jgi:nucleotide-binding universal stress UspA family protein